MIFRSSEACGCWSWIAGAVPRLDAPPQNLPDVVASSQGPDPIDPASDNGQARRNLVWGMPWRGQCLPFVGQAYCVGGSRSSGGGWCPTCSRTEDPDEVGGVLPVRRPVPPGQLREVSSARVGIINSEGVVATDYIEGPLFDASEGESRRGPSRAGQCRTWTRARTRRSPSRGRRPPRGSSRSDKYSSKLSSWWRRPARRIGGRRPRPPVVRRPERRTSSGSSRRPAS